MDPPLILTHNHDPKVIFKPHFSLMDTLESPASHVSYQDLWSNFQRISHSYNDLLSQNRDLSDAHRALREEYNTLRDTYWCLRYKHQELVDDAINARIESWRHVVRLEEVKKELRLLRQGDSQPPSSKRKFTDIQDDDHDGEDSDWSASSSAHSHSFSNDTFNTPASGSSKIATAPAINELPSDHHLSSRPHQATSEALRETPTEIRTPKRRRQRSSECNDDHTPGDPSTHRQSAIGSPNGKLEERHGGSSPEPSPKRTTSTRRTPPQTRSKTRLSRRRRSSLKDQNATAAAVAAALSGAAASNSSHSFSPSPPDRRSL